MYMYLLFLKIKLLQALHESWQITLLKVFVPIQAVVYI